MRLNLPNFHCVQFELTSEFSIPRDKDAEIEAFMDLTHTHDPGQGIEGGTRVALFGSRTRTRGITHQVQGRLAMTPRPTDLGILLSVSSTRASDQLGTPPKSFRPVSFLVESAGKLFGTIDVSCHAVFNYDLTQGYRSKVSLPIPMMLQEGETGVTHIESAQFSRRDNDEVDYRVIVANRDEAELFVHSVDFESPVELSRNSVRRLIDKARKISNQLLFRIDES